MVESKLAGFLKGEKPGGEKPPSGQSDLRTALERELEGEDAELAKELQRTRAEEIIARRRLTIGSMRGGNAIQNTDGGKTEGRGKEWLTDVAQGLLERGLDPSVVGRTIDYLLGVAQAPLVGLPGSPAPAQGMTFADVQALFKMGQESSRSDPAIAAILEKLNTKIEALEHKTSSPPPEKKGFILVKADGTIQEVDGGRPLILEPAPVLVQGEPLEVVKEKNRHAERMVEVEGENTYKAAKGEVLHKILNIPKDLGADISERILGQGQTETSEGILTMQYMKCATEGCGFEIPHPPGAKQITCPKCASVYTQEAGS